MKTSKVLLTSVCCAVIGAVAAQAATAPASRMWTDTKGRQVEATFQAMEGDNILLQTKDGTTHRFPLTNLSAEDQQIAQSLKATAPVQPKALDASIAQAASKIDYLVAKGVVRANPQRAKDGLPPITSYNPLTSDEQFVRRIYLDVVGRIPSHDEALAFIQDSSPTKRAKLIDMLLDSEGYNSHMFNYLADMMRVTENFDNNNVRGVPYIKWLKEQVAANLPWDKVVHKMMVTSGKMWGEDADAPATGYLLRDSGMPLDNLANTLTIFLGTDVACAQCHDHPFADWTQKQFYEMASFFGATTTRLNGKDFEGGDRGMMLMTEAEKIIEANGGDLTRIRNGLQQYIGANRVAVMDRKENTMKLPHDYKYKDGKPGDPVKPKFITWAKSDASNPAYKQGKKDEEKLRNSFAAWMTHKENPRFAMTIANRLWKKAFGSGVAEPVTNIDDPKNATNPELLLHLTAEMKRLAFNLKDFQRLVYNTKAYQAEATTEAIAMGTPYYFQGPQLRRMSAEQTWDSYMTLMLGNPDTRKKPAQDLYSRAVNLDLANPKLDAKTVLMKYDAFRNIGKTQAAMMNSAEEGGDSMMMEGNMMGGRGGRGMEYFRASELPQPARDGHFLTEFGQSRRLLIDGGSKVGSVPQVLMLMNGSAQQMLTQSGSPVLTQIEASKTPEEKVDTLFLSVMSRKPTANEQALAKREIESSGSDAFPNLVWALINTREFIFVQ